MSCRFCRPRTILRDRSGAIAVMVGFLIAALILVVSLGTEVVAALGTQRKMQSAADSSALSAARVHHYNPADQNRYVVEGAAIAAQAGFTASNATCGATPTVYVSTTLCSDVSSLTLLKCADSSEGCVEALIRQPFLLRLAKVLYPNDFVLHGRAVARWAYNGGCAAILDPKSAGALRVNGSGVVVTLQDCNLWVDSNNTSAGAVQVAGGATLTCKGLFVGGTTSPDAATLTSGGCRTYINQPSVTDPYANVNPPSLTTPSTTTVTTPSAGLAITPVAAGNPSGVSPVALSGGIKLTGNNQIQYICPGIYVIDGAQNGIFQINQGNTLQLVKSGDTNWSDCAGDAGTGIAFVLTSSTGPNIPYVAVNSGASIILTGIDQIQASASGLPLKTLFFQSRNASPTPGSSFNGSPVLDGVLYFPRQLVAINGNQNANADCFEVISWQLQVSGNTTFTAKACDPGFDIGGYPILVQ